MFTAVILRSYADSSLAAISFQETVVDDTLLPAFDGQVAAGGVNVELFVSFTKANLKAIALQSDQPITLYTNAPSTGAPQDTIALVKGQAMIWTLQTDGSGECPFAGNVTAMYATCPGATLANVKIRGICHQHS
jgi:hypothetical protein